jgi:hypothetical protein
MMNSFPFPPFQKCVYHWQVAGTAQAGGVAHDFNNLVMIIKGYSDLLLDTATPQARPFIEEIKNAGERASGLTRQWLSAVNKCSNHKLSSGRSRSTGTYRGKTKTLWPPSEATELISVADNVKE